MAFHSFADTFGVGSGPILLLSLPTIMELYMDKGEVVRIAAIDATKAILRLFPPESMRLVLRTLEDILAKGKWRTKVGVLDAMRSISASARDAVAAELGELLP
jgi:elongation factor 3